MGDVAKQFLVPMALLFGEPRGVTDQAARFLREYGEVLKDFTDDELSLAKQIVVARHKYRNWPLPAECLEACNEARVRRRLQALEKAARSQQIRQPCEPKREPTAEACQFVDDCADGKIDCGVLSSSLRRLALNMQSRRERASSNRPMGEVA